MVSNADVVRTLERIADLLEIRGENTFKAHRLAASGSRAHDVRLRGHALRMEMTLNEYGLFRIDDGARVASETGEDVHAALGPPLIPPQRREDPAEIDTRATIPVATEV